MHEASIAISIIEIAEEHCKRDGYSTIKSINVRIGSASGVLPGAMAMAFEIVRNDTMAASAVLNVEEVPLGGTCRECDKAFTTEEQFILACPACGGKDFSMDTGREMEITEIEVE